MIVEAMVVMVVVTLVKDLVPMTWWSGVLGRVRAVPEQWYGARITSLPVVAANNAERRVIIAVRRGSRLLPFKPKCLAEATAGQFLLRQMSVPGVVAFGLRPGDPESTGPWKAHAWLLGRRGALTGGPAARGFTATSLYEVRGGLSAEQIDLTGSFSTDEPTTCG